MEIETLRGGWTEELGELLTPAQAAHALHTTEGALAKHRARGTGCPFVFLRHNVPRYRKSVVDAYRRAWLERDAETLARLDQMMKERGNIRERNLDADLCR